MARRKSGEIPSQTRPVPAVNVADRENQMISLAVNEVERRILSHEATSQELVHYLRLGSRQHELEMEKLRQENELLRAKTEAIRSVKEIEEVYNKAIQAMSVYRGSLQEASDVTGV